MSTESHDIREWASQPQTPPPPVDNPPGGEFPCDECGRTFESANALNGHKKSHRVKKVPCPECGKIYSEGTGLAVHRQAKHGVQSKNGASKHSSRRERVLCPECKRPFRKDNLTRHRAVKHGVVGPTVVAEEAEEQDAGWSVDDVFDTVVSMLWPTGQMPVQAIHPLMAWRESTAKMLVEVGQHE